ncbi:hypothetical protein [Salinisphaera sp. G21_0]|uniref:hypothetical protein n=1 Tax=Salinisphaera sp. G21_0 TaxID=2821094 RepID=UPI001ADA7089|nr:hypothetical protein [Salinisphaera sp. G21_0]MBO9482272.1 hypothetical protein [Salinisphaera sp. G21_0]
MKLDWAYQHAPHGLACFESAGCYHWVEIQTRGTAFTAVIQSDEMLLELKPCSSSQAARKNIELVLSLFNAKPEGKDSK